MAFVVRSHRHLWGKNNENPLAFLFNKGLKNEFAKTMLMGWNKFGQNRPLENWGLSTPLPQEKLVLNPGIVIPFIQDKKLQSVFIHPLEGSNQTLLLPGSLKPTMILGNTQLPIILISNLLDGLFLFQESKKQVCVMIHPDLELDLDVHTRSILTTCDHLYFFHNEISDNFKHPFSDLVDNQQCIKYSKKEEILEQILS